MWGWAWNFEAEETVIGEVSVDGLSSIYIDVLAANVSLDASKFSVGTENFFGK